MSSAEIGLDDAVGRSFLTVDRALDAARMPVTTTVSRFLASPAFFLAAAASCLGLVRRQARTEPVHAPARPASSWPTPMRNAQQVSLQLHHLPLQEFV
jgi:hypothetical protein